MRFKHCGYIGTLTHGTSYSVCNMCCKHSCHLGRASQFTLYIVMLGVVTSVRLHTLLSDISCLVRCKHCGHLSTTVHFTIYIVFFHTLQALWSHWCSCSLYFLICLASALEAQWSPWYCCTLYFLIFIAKCVEKTVVILVRLYTLLSNFYCYVCWKHCSHLGTAVHFTF